MKYFYSGFLSNIIIIMLLNIASGNCFSQTLTEKDKIDILLSHEKYKEALDKIKQLIYSDSLDPELFYRKGITEQFLYQNDNAVKSFNKAISLDSINAAFYYAKARSLSLIGRNKDALNIYKTAFQKDSTNINGALSFSSYLISLDMFNEARKVYNSLLRYDSLNSSFYSKIGYCYFQVDSLQPALENYQRAIDINDMDFNDLQQLIVIYIALKKVDIADSIINNRISKFPDVPCLIRLKGDICYKKTDFINAVKYYTAAIEEGETADYIFPKLGLSYFFYANENDSLSYNDKIVYYEKARDAFETYLPKDKSNPLVIYYLGVIYSKLGEFDKAILYLGKSLDILLPSFTADEYWNLGECYRIKKKYDSAAVAYKMSLIFNAENDNVLTNLIVMYSQDLKDEGGIVCYLNEFLRMNKDLNEDYKKRVKGSITYFEDELSKKPTKKSGGK